MGKKIISIAGIAFAIVFVAVFIFVWSTSQSIIKGEASQINEMYYAEVPFDTNLFDNKVVSKESIINLAEDIGNTGFTRSTKLFFYTGTKEQDPQEFGMLGDKSEYASDYLGFVSSTLRSNLTAKEYRVFMHKGLNDSVDGIAIQEIN